LGTSAAIPGTAIMKPLLPLLLAQSSDNADNPPAPDTQIAAQRLPVGPSRRPIHRDEIDAIVYRCGGRAAPVPGDPGRVHAKPRAFDRSELQVTQSTGALRHAA